MLLKNLKDALDYCQIVSSPSNLILDGSIKRFSVSGNGDDAGWYIGDESKKIVTIGNWRTGKKATVMLNKHRYTENEIAQWLAEVTKKANAEKKKLAQEAKEKALELYKSTQKCSDENQYLKRKGVKPNSFLHEKDGNLIVPIIDKNAIIKSLQIIDPEGNKKFIKHGQVKGCFFTTKYFKDSKKIILCEGVATGLSISEAIDDSIPVICCLSAGNVPAVAEQFDDKEILIVADNDASGTGERFAKASGKPYCVIPVVGMDANDYAREHDLKRFLDENLNKTNTKNIETFSKYFEMFDDLEKSPGINWLIDKFIPKGGLGMLHGASGSGKSFYALDLALRIAKNMDYCGVQINNKQRRPVVYLAGEGKNGYKGRYLAWCKHNKTKVENALISKLCITLTDKEEFDEMQEALDALPLPPCLIVIDTLHRHWDGDENSSADAKIMIDACAKLQKRYNATVLIVHHTGVSSEAQGRARGSSAWKAALDFELSLQRINAKTIKVSQAKNKEAENFRDLFFAFETIPLDEFAEGLSSNIIYHEDLTPTEKKKQKNIREAESILINAMEAAGDMLIKNNDGTLSIKKNNLRDILIAMYPGKNILSIKNMLRENTPYRWLNTLCVNGTVVVDEMDTITIIDKSIIDMINMAGGAPGG